MNKRLHPIRTGKSKDADTSYTVNLGGTIYHDKLPPSDVLFASTTEVNVVASEQKPEPEPEEPVKQPEPMGRKLPRRPDDGTLKMPSPSWENYNFSNDFQDAILACVIRFPQRFWRVGEIIKPEYFTGPSAVETVFRLKGYVEKYGKYPTFVTLGNFAFVWTKHRNAETAEELAKYIKGLALLDLRDVDAIFDLALPFARERALFDVLRRAHLAQQEGKPFDLVGEYQAAALTGQDDESESVTDLMAEELPDDPPVVHGVLEAGDVVVMAGASKGRKTFCALNMAVSVASGEPWLGFKTQKGPVLYINFELKRAKAREHVLAIADATQIAPEALKDFQIAHLRGSTTKPDDLLLSLSNLVRKVQPSLVIIDPIYPFFGKASENSAEDMARVMAGFGRLARQGPAVLLIHHFPKGSMFLREAADRASGSGMIHRYVDAMLTLTAHAEEGCSTLEVSSRNAPVAPFVLRWQYPLWVPDRELNPKDLKKPKTGREQVYEAKDLLDGLKDGPLSKADWFDRVRGITGMSDTTFRRLRDELISRNRVVKEGQKYRLNDPENTPPKGGAKTTSGGKASKPEKKP